MRFLRAATPRDKQRLAIPTHKEGWCFVDEHTILEKAKQGLRSKTEWKVSSGDEREDHSDLASLQSSEPGSLQTSSTDSINDQYHQGTTSYSKDQASLDNVASLDLWGDHCEESLDWRNLPSSEMLFGRDLLDQISGDA